MSGEIRETPADKERLVREARKFYELVRAHRVMPNYVLAVAGEDAEADWRRTFISIHGGAQFVAEIAASLLRQACAHLENTLGEAGDAERSVWLERNAAVHSAIAILETVLGAPELGRPS
jgi:hypothetical protein